jgi:hippurate hydrolase
MSTVLQAVVSAGGLLTDGTRSVLPGTARIRGDCRSLSPEVSRAIEESMRGVAEGVTTAHGCAKDAAPALTPIGLEARGRHH